MGWGEPHARGAGTTGEIEEAHKALDSLGIENGTLAVRVIEMAKTSWTIPVNKKD